MLRHLTGHLGRNAVAYLALFVALGGTSYAAVSLKRSAVKAKHIAAGAITSPKVKDRSLLAVDFARGQLPRGEQGAAGAAGARGDAGARGETGARGEAGSRGEQGPGARKIAWEATVTDYGHELVRVGPWTVSADCDMQGGAGVFVSVAGPGTAEYYVLRSTSTAGAATPRSGGVTLTSGGYLEDFSGQAAADAYSRQTGMLLLSSGDTVAQVELFVLADERPVFPTPGTCAVHGTAIPAA